MNELNATPRSQIRWVICGLLLLALVLNYMDRQTLSLTITAVEKEISLSATQYGRLEKGFGYAFAFGGLFFGVLADRISVRWLYPIVLLGWSSAGIATGYADRLGAWLGPWLQASFGRGTVDWMAGEGMAIADGPPTDVNAYLGFMLCRVVLGFFEAGQWPCALVTTQRLLTAEDRPFGNSILQSGASIGAILTPLVVSLFDNGELGWWRSPYVVIGCLGILWVGPWLATVWRVNLNRPASDTPSPTAMAPELRRDVPSLTLQIRRYLALVVVVITINLTWQYFRVWLPKMLEQYHGYTPQNVRWFVTAYYIATDVGCIAAGVSVKWLAGRGTNVHRARLIIFGICAILTSLSTVASQLPKGPLLLAVFLVIGFGALGMFPNYYSFTQEISGRHQGKISGSLGFITWVVTSEMQEIVGKVIDRTESYASGIFWIGLAPMLGLIAILLLWGRSTPQPVQESAA